MPNLPVLRRLLPRLQRSELVPIGVGAQTPVEAKKTNQSDNEVGSNSERSLELFSKRWGTDLYLMNDDSNFDTHYRITSPPNEFNIHSDSIENLQLSFNGRWGNYIFQLINMFYIAGIIGAKRLYIFSRDFIPLDDRSRAVGEFQVLDAATSPAPVGRTMTGVFFNPAPFGQMMNGLTPARRQEIARRYVRPLLSQVRPHNNLVRPEDVVVHIRSGDIFEGEEGMSGSNMGGQLYVQPPLSFYLSSIERAFRNSSGAVHIIAENARNPVIFPLIQQVEMLGLPLNVRLNQPLEDDLNWLFAARKLVLSNGTIGIAIALLSGHVNEGYFFRTDCTGTVYPVNHYLDNKLMKVHIAEDIYGDYIASRNWLNNEDQRRSMVDFSVERLGWCD